MQLLDLFDLFEGLSMFWIIIALIGWIVMVLSLMAFFKGALIGDHEDAEQYYGYTNKLLK